MEWNVLHYNTNTDKIEMMNIFEHSSFKSDVEKLLKKYKKDKDYDAFKENLKKELMFDFHYKYEYEIICGGLFTDCSKEKIDVYMQVLPNLENLAKYIIMFNEKK